MGYTHYIRQPKSFTKENWTKFVSEARDIINNSSVPLANGMGEKGTFPEFGKDYVLFNGEKDQSCESCVIEKGAVDFSFCKTRELPYDEIVVAIYKLARKYNNSITLSSDGGDSVFMI